MKAKGPIDTPPTDLSEEAKCVVNTIADGKSKSWIHASYAAASIKGPIDLPSTDVPERAKYVIVTNSLCMHVYIVTTYSKRKDQHG